MSVELDSLKKLAIRLVVERKTLIETLAAKPANEQLSNDLLQRLATLAAAGAAVSHEIAIHEPHTGWTPS
jgi:hypothetical protein